jgi:hypothetical protein
MFQYVGEERPIISVQEASNFVRVRLGSVVLPTMLDLAAKTGDNIG